MPPADIYFFSGKGGVGKTTLAAATAVWLARQGRRVLLASTDPAHNLSDVFARPVGHQGAWIEADLFALEIDARARWLEATGPGESGGEAGTPGGKPPGALQRKLAEAVRVLGQAPGVDEMISLDLLMQAAASPEHDAVVFDTAPTGHTLRLMQLPGMLDGWFGSLLALRGHFARLGRAFRRLLPRRPAEEPDLGAELASARERVAGLRAMLADPERTRFVLVSIPEAMSVLESERTIYTLAEQGIRVHRLLANQVQPDSPDCVHCRARRELHLRELAHLAEVARAAPGQVPVQVIETRSREQRGVEALFALGEELWG
jgi:arsenite-transporting ATPase